MLVTRILIKDRLKHSKEFLNNEYHRISLKDELNLIKNLYVFKLNQYE